MAIRVLLAPLFHSAEDRRTLDTAFALARRFRCHVDALLVQPDPGDTIPIVGEGISADTIRRLLESATSAIEQQRKATRAMFDDAKAVAGIDEVDGIAQASDKPTAAFVEAVGQCDIVVPARALLADLVVFAGARSENAIGLRATFEAVLLKSRRPMLVTAESPPAHIGRTVAIAWNATPEARSALDGAMPFLQSAAAVHLIAVASARSDADALDGARDYLAAHGIGSDSHVVEPGDEPVGAALMRKAEAIGADLLVMGGYGHARLRERILGGVTQHIVSHPGLPILLAH